MRSENPVCLPFPASTLAEGIVWHPVTGGLGWVDILGHTIYSADAGLARAVGVTVPKLTTALVPTAAGGWLCLCEDGLHAFAAEAPEDQRLIPLDLPADLAAGEVRFNDAKADAQGRIWAGTMSLKGKTGQGRLYLFESGRPGRAVYEPVDLANGIAWSLTGDTMYFIDSLRRCVRRFQFTATSGAIAEQLPPLDLSAEPGLPDGCTLDAEGMLWIAHWGGACVTRRDPASGRILAQIDLPVANVTSCAFGGPAWDRLFISTAKADSGETFRDEPAAGGVFAVFPGVLGRPAPVVAASWPRVRT